MSKKKNVLYTNFTDWDEYLPAVVIKCDACEEMFQVKKGLYLTDGYITCYKHFDKEILRQIGLTIK